MQKWRCPTCKAPYRDGIQCYRCHCDLSLLLAILEQSKEWKEAAILFLREGWVEEAFEAIQRSLSLYRDREAEELEALIYAAQGHFDYVLPFLT